MLVFVLVTAHADFFFTLNYYNDLSTDLCQFAFALSAVVHGIS